MGTIWCRVLIGALATVDQGDTVGIVLHDIVGDVDQSCPAGRLDLNAGVPRPPFVAPAVTRNLVVPDGSVITDLVLEAGRPIVGDPVVFATCVHIPPVSPQSRAPVVVDILVPDGLMVGLPTLTASRFPFPGIASGSVEGDLIVTD